MARKQATNTLEAALAEVFPEPVLVGNLDADIDLHDQLTMKEDAFGKFPGPPRNLDPVRVTDYDANGEAIDVDAKTFTQAELPGMPEVLPPLWGNVDQHRVGKVSLSFSGRVELDHEQEDVAAALVLGQSVRLIVECNIDGKHFTLQRKKGHAVGLDGTAVLKVVTADLAGGTGGTGEDWE